MSFCRSVLLILACVGLPGVSHAQECPETVAGNSMADLMGEHGGALGLFDYVEDEIAVIEFFLEEADNAMAPDTPDPDAVAAIEALTAELKTQQAISDAAICHASG